MLLSRVAPISFTLLNLALICPPVKAQSWCHSEQISPGVVWISANNLVNGDGDLYGKNPYIRVRAKSYLLKYTSYGGILRFEIDIYFKESGGDNSILTGQKNFDYKIYTSRDCNIIEVGTDSGYATMYGGWNETHAGVNGHGLIRGIDCLVDTPGSDIGEVGCSVGLRNTYYIIKTNR